MKIYNLHPLATTTGRVMHNFNGKIDDKIILEQDKEGYIECSNTTQDTYSIDTTNKFAGDFSKITDVHFIRGARFDRDYFRRLFPNINVRTKVDKAQVIIYDNKSIWENNETQETVIFYDGDYWAYLSYNDLMHAILAVKNKNPHYTSRVFIDTNSKVYKFLDNSKDWKTVRIVKPSEYVASVNAAKLPFITTEDAMSELPSNLKQSNLTISEAHSFLSQILSEDKEAAKTAFDSITMYESKKYFPIQVLFYILARVKEQSTYSTSQRNKDSFRSNKNAVFFETMGKCVDYVPSAFSYVQLLDYVMQIILTHAKNSSKESRSILRELLLSETLYNKFNNISTSFVKVPFMKIEFTNNVFKDLDEEPVAKSADIGGFIV